MRPISVMCSLSDMSSPSRRLVCQSSDRLWQRNSSVEADRPASKRSLYCRTAGRPLAAFPNLDRPTWKGGGRDETHLPVADPACVGAQRAAAASDHTCSGEGAGCEAGTGRVSHVQGEQLQQEV